MEDRQETGRPPRRLSRERQQERRGGMGGSCVGKAGQTVLGSPLGVGGEGQRGT